MVWWQWVLENSGWLVPTIIIIGNEIVKQTSTDVDNDIWKMISYVLEKVFGIIGKAGNKSTNGSDYPVYASDDMKPGVIKQLDKISEELKIKVNKLTNKIK